MKGELRTFLFFVALPAVVLAAAGFSMLVFGTIGFSRELKNASQDEQLERYERNVRDRMARKLRAYRRNGKSDYEWNADSVPWGTNVSSRLKYGYYSTPEGVSVGWAKVDDGKVIGYDVEPFSPEYSRRIWAFAAGAVALVGLFLVLAAKGFKSALAAKRTREELEMKNSFLDAVSHELNTPLASIVPLSSALARDAIKDPARRREALTTVSREASRMARMIEELLNAVRLRNGRMVFASDRFDLRSAASEAVESVRAYHRNCSISLADGDRVFALGDRDKTVQVLVNFLDNACKYAGASEIVVECARAGNGMSSVAVSDRGPGLPEDGLSRVFHKFYRAGNSSVEGLGLGLNLSAALAEGMGGKVHAENRAGGGSVFTLELKDGGDAAEGRCENG